MRIEKHLDEVMKLKGFRRDKELAEWLGVAPSAVCNYRKGDRSMENEKCVKIALELGIDPTRVIMATDMDRAERSGQRSLWEVFTSRMATAASIILALVVTNFVTPSPAEAKQINDLQQQRVASIYLM